MSVTAARGTSLSAAEPGPPRFRLAHWEAMPGPMRLPVFDAMAIELGQHLVVLGGFTHELEATRAIQIRHPSASWQPIGSAMLEPRAQATLLPLSGGRVLVLGGYSGTWGKDAVAHEGGETLDPLVAGSARAIPTFGASLEGHTATPLGDGRIAVASGCSLRIFDSESELWIQSAELSVERRHHAAVLLGSTLVLMGGDEEGSIESIALDDHALRSTRWATTLPAPLDDAAAIALDRRRAFLVGGYDRMARATVRATWVLDVAKRLVRRGPDLPLERGVAHLTLAEHRRGIIVADGEWRIRDARGNANAALLVTSFEPDAKVWALPALGPALDLARRSLVRRADGTLEAIGGYRYRAPHDALPGEAVGVIVDGSAQRLVVDGERVAD